jgi:hypothetical protein
MNMADELVAVADVVSLVVFGVGEDHEHAVGREIVHLAPEAGADEQALRGRIQQDAFLAATVEEAQADGAGHADAELAELLMSVETAADTGVGAMDPVDTANRERQRTTQLGDGKTTAGVTALGDLD